MKLNTNTLDTHLKKTLASLYLISAAEPLLAEFARQKILNTAKKNGYSEKIVLHVDASFQWDHLAQIIMNRSLFDDKKCIDLRNVAAKFDEQALKIIKHFIDQAPQDIVLIITTEKLTAAQQKAKWFQCVEKGGVYCPIWPIPSAEYPQWIQAHAQSQQITIDLDAAKLLTAAVEGNLFAATQAIEKCGLLYPGELISTDKMKTVISDNAQFTVFDLTNALLLGKPKRALRILSSLKKTGTDAILVLWAIARETRELLQFSYDQANGKSLQQVLLPLWASKKPFVKAALTRLSTDTLKKAHQQCADIDSIIKGAQTGQAWESLAQVCLLLCHQGNVK